MNYICSICQQEHDELPDIGSDRPDHYWDVDEDERERRIKLTSDTCEIDGEHFFIRGVVQIPIFGDPDGFGFGCWVSLKEENYRTYLQNFDTAEIGPFFGWLCTRIDYYAAETELLKTSVIFRGSGLRPSIKLHQSEEHQLAIDQRKGISKEQAWEIVHFYTNRTSISRN